MTKLEQIRDHIESRSKREDHLLNFPFLEKKERLSIPLLGNEYISIPHINSFPIQKQATKDTCGLCSAEMVINTLLHSKKIHEKDIIKSQITPNIGFFKETVGIFPGQLQYGIQQLLSEYKLPYTAQLKHFISYSEIKEQLKKGSYIIFSEMGDAIDNPHRHNHGHKDLSLQDVHHPHYIVLLSLDEPAHKVEIANPFGYRETMEFKEFRQRISLHPQYLRSSKIYIPLVESGLYMPRSCIIVAPNI